MYAVTVVGELFRFLLLTLAVFLSDYRKKISIRVLFEVENLVGSVILGKLFVVRIS